MAQEAPDKKKDAHKKEMERRKEEATDRSPAKYSPVPATKEEIDEYHKNHPMKPDPHEKMRKDVVLSNRGDDKPFD